MDRKQIKATAKATLGGKLFASEWINALLMCLIASFLMCLIPGVGTLIVTGPLAYGLTKAFLKVSREGGKVDISMLFDGFKEDFAGNFLLSFISGLIIGIGFCLFVIPGIIASLYLSQIFYIKADNPEMSAMDCIRASKDMMSGHCGELFMLYLSFIGFAIVGVLCFGLGTLWLAPYMEMASAYFYLNLKGPETAVNDVPSYDYQAPGQQF